MKPYEIDDTGEAILEVLSDNGRLTSEEIADQLNLPVEEVNRRIETLEKDRIILGYEAVVNWQRIRQHDVRALIEVKVTPERNVGFDSVAEAIYRFPEVTSVLLLSGGFDLLVQVEGKNLREVALFVAEKLSPIQGVQSTVSHFILKKYKEKGIILTETPDSKRLPVAP
jgi:DNA-binding Lrp family transcriptional regulator